MPFDAAALGAGGNDYRASHTTDEPKKAKPDAEGFVIRNYPWLAMMRRAQAVHASMSDDGPWDPFADDDWNGQYVDPPDASSIKNVTPPHGGKPPALES